MNVGGVLSTISVVLAVPDACAGAPIPILLALLSIKNAVTKTATATIVVSIVIRPAVDAT